MMIQTQNLTKDYGGGRGIMDLSLEVPDQCVFGFVGPNGSGKTTTIRILCGLIRPDNGEAWLNGMEVLPSNHVAIKKMIGFLPDEFGVYDQMSVWEYLDFFGAAYRIPPAERRRRIQEVLEICDAQHMIDYQVNSLSRGMHQKVGICKTMLHDPSLLILDEPANGLDPYARIEMRETILRLKSMGKTVMISSHILPELGSMCDQVAIIEKGHLLTQGSLAEITHSLQQNIVLEILVGTDMDDAIACLEELETVKSVAGSMQEIRVEFLGNRAQIADLNIHLTENGVRVIGLREAEVDLENVFLSVTGHSSNSEAEAVDQSSSRPPRQRRIVKKKKDGGKQRRRQRQVIDAPPAPEPEPLAERVPFGGLPPTPATGAEYSADEARRSVAAFLKAFIDHAPEHQHFRVLVELSDGVQVENIWLTDLSYIDGAIKGHLETSSMLIEQFTKGAKVGVQPNEIMDWMYVENGLLVGGYSILHEYYSLPRIEQQRYFVNKPYRIEE